MEDLHLSVTKHERKPEKSSISNYHHDTVRWASKMNYFKKEAEFYNKILLLSDMYVDIEFADRKAEYLQELLRGLDSRIDDAKETLTIFENYLFNCREKPKSIKSDEAFEKYAQTMVLVNHLMNDLNNFKTEVFQFIKTSTNIG